MCFGSRADGTWKLQIDSIISELKVLQDNLNFAMIAAVGNCIAQPLFSPPAVAPSKKPGLQERQFNATVGLDEHVNYIIDFIKRPGVCLVGIHGQAGLGKTTLLNEIVAKVENSEKRLFAYIEMNDDLRILQSSLLLQLGGGKRDFQTTSLGRSAILYQLRKLKQQGKVVRIAIDNLSDVRLVGQLFPHSLGKVLPVDSSILITCPSVAIVNKIDQLCRRTMLSDYHYLPFKLPHLAPEYAKTLFVFHLATAAEVPILPVDDEGGIFSSSKYRDLINQFLPLCEGLPMALKVVGHYFSNSANCNEENWTAVAKRMKMAEDDMETTEDRMFAKLTVIFEKLGLAQKEAFLDIATFFQSWDWRIVERIVGKPQLEQLVNQGFVHSKLKDVESFTGIMQLTCYSEQPWKTEMVMMHDLLHAIACRRAHGNRVQSEDQAHLPDRLLMDSPGMELSQVQGLSLINCKEPLQGAMLEKMQDLRVLILQNIAIKGFCSKALNQLQFLYWGKTQVSREVRLPFQIGKLRKLEMMILCAHEIDLLMKFPPHLKDLTIIGCNNMEELPETLLVLSALVELHLVSCNRLLDLTPSFGSLKMLCRFRLENCLSIRYLPRCIGVLSSLHELDLSGCTNLTTLSSEIGKLVGLKKLNLSRCKSLVRLPAEIGCLRNLLSLNLGQLQIANLPVEIGNLRALEDLSLSGCAQLEKLPKEIGHLASLLRLNLSSCTSLQELPKEIGKLMSLQRLSLNSCSSLSRLPDQLYEIVTLQALDLDYCKSLTHLSPEIGNLCSLQRLSLNCCTRLTWLPTEITSLPCLQVINLVGCTGLKHEHPEEMEKITRQNSTTAYRDPGGLISLEGPKNRSFKLYSITY
jgi:Leucine-rich repeat (LRR) protein